MRVSLIIIGLLALSATILTGCPPVAPEAETGGFYVEGDLSAVVDKIDDDFVGEVTKALEKGGGYEGGMGGMLGLSQEELQEIGDSIKNQAFSIDIYLYAYSSGGVGKGGGYLSYSFYIPIVDHQFRAHCGGILAGTYGLSITFRDEQGNMLLTGWKNVVIEGGVNQNENLVVDFVYNYPFHFSIFGLPGWYQTDEWGYYGQASLVESATGMSYYTSWYVGGVISGNDGLVFETFLPLNFSGGVLYIVDGDGNDVYCQLPLVITELGWDNFRFSDILHFPYLASDALGGLDLEIDFAWE